MTKPIIFAAVEYPQSEPSRSLCESIGVATTILMSAAQYRQFNISTVAVWIVPPIRMGQIRFFFDRRGRPVALATWAFLSALTEAAWMNDPGKIIQPDEWNEGDRPWIIDIVAPYGHAGGVCSALRKEFTHQHATVSWLRDKTSKGRRVGSVRLTASSR